ncbi:hypothetical protein AVEN_156766-1 [Araneus ventricosus]|uniref:Uncharacterized protein n=1 Tax=Araneus ventricosus TaxID=182803 RepID=A0A4Y2FWP1_ARAVE|nr:hypothetical protein AVEN_156766-1 [Araneus ventricosus]
MPGDEVIGDSFQPFLFEVWHWLPHMPKHCVNTLRGIVKCRANSTTAAKIEHLQQKFSTCGTRTPRGTRRTIWGSVKDHLVVREGPFGLHGEPFGGT